jgi:acyl phosphate:glycerol-3-phosphate acyltransferase
MENLWLLVVAVVSYVFGSFPIAKLVTGKTQTEWGKDSWGTMSTIQKAGKGKGVIVFAIDIAKGFISVFIFTGFVPSFVSYDTLYLLGISAFFVILGQNYSIFLKFRGGRGLATGLGVMFALDWVLALSCLAIMLVSVFAIELWMNGSLHGEFFSLARNNLLGRALGIIFCLVAIYFFAGLWQLIVTFPMMMLIMFSHRKRVRNYILENKQILQERFSIKGGN